MRLLLCLTTAAVGLVGQASAETYAARGVEIEHAAATLTVISEDRNDVDVSVTAGARVAAPSVRVEGDHVLIDGGLNNRLRGCGTTLGVRHVRINGIGDVREADLPHIVVRAPRTLNLGVGGAVFAEIGDSGGGEIALNGCGDASIGASRGDLELALNGSGDAHAGRVDGKLGAALNGSGSLRVDSAGGAGDLALRGSGDLVVGDVGGAIEAQLLGSGSLRAGNANGSADVQLMGSGDLGLGAVSGSLEAQLSGSGNVDIASVQGERAELAIASSGDLVVRGGRVNSLDVSDHGSGTLRFSGAAGSTRAQLSSSGDIYIRDAGRIEHMSDSGSGDVHLGT